MSVVLRELALKLGLDVDAQSFAKGELAAKTVEKGLEKLVDWVKESAEAFVELVKSTAEYANETGDMAQATGLSARALQELRVAAVKGSAEVEDLNVGLFHLSRSMAGAKKGSEENTAAFHRLGVKVTDSKGKLRATDDVIMDVAESISKMPDGAEKTALAMDIFGRSGAKLIPMLNEGREHLDEFRKSAAVMTDEQLEAGDKLSKSIKALANFTKIFWRQAIAPLLPAINDLVQKYLTWRKANAAILQQNIRKYLGIIIQGIKLTGEALDLIIKNFDMIKIAVLSTVVVWGLLNAAAVSAAISTAAAWALAAAPFVAIGAALATLLLVFDDLRGYAAGEDSLFGRWADTLAAWQKPNANDPWWLKAVKELVIALEKALGLYNKMNHIFGPDEENKAVPSRTGASAKLPFTSGPGMEVPKPYFQIPENQNAPGTFWYGYHQARAAGVGVAASLTTRNAEFAEPQQATLPAGGGVMRVPAQVQQNINFVIQGDNRTAQDIAEAITQKLDEVHESAAAALE